MTAPALATHVAPPNQVAAIAAVVLGAVAMGASPVFVRLAEVGPFTSAFWRVALALPALWLWARMEGGPPLARADRGAIIAVVVAGALFAGDLTFWHLAIMNTSVANATFLATLAPVWVVLGSRLVVGESVGTRTIAGLALCLAGGAALVYETLNLGAGNLDGDLYGLVTSFFFGTYMLAVRRARGRLGSGRIIFYSTLVTALLLGIEAFLIEDQHWPSTMAGVAALLALAFVSHAGGQGLLAWALGFLPAAFSSLVIFMEGVAAALLGWLVLSEAISPIQAFGGLLIFVGIWAARPKRTRRTGARH